MLPGTDEYSRIWTRTVGSLARHPSAVQLAHFGLTVENDYTVVFLTAGGRHSPGWNWVWKAYRSLSRKYVLRF